MDFCKKTFRNIFLLGLLTVWIPGFFYLNPLASATEVEEEEDQINSLIMEVNQKEFFMIVGERRVEITKFAAGSKFKTDLLDQNNGEIKLDAFKKGERVQVKGFKLTDGAIKAESIKKISPHPTDTTN